MQLLRTERPTWLEQRTLHLEHLCTGAYRRAILVVSHRWEAAEEPDGNGEQALAVQGHLMAHPEIELVWYGKPMRLLF